MRIVRTRSIPNVDSDRLLTDLATLHAAFHTVQGLRLSDGPRRNLVDNGRKARLIAAELDRRQVPRPPCRFCGSSTPPPPPL